MNPAHFTQALALIHSGMSCVATARKLGLPNATLARHLIRLAESGGCVDTALAGKPTGRPVVFSPDEAETALARWYRLSKESLPVAAYFFARDARVRPEICEVIVQIEERELVSGKKASWPDSVRRAFRVTAQERAAFRGKKHAQQEEMITRRGMFEDLVDGSRREILPGDTWELDDYSANQPYVFQDPSTGEHLLGRQVLACRDLAAARWLGYDHIGRERDAYRGEDVLRYIHRLVVAWGLPRRLRLERGIWESSAVHGIAVAGMASRWGDLRDIILVEHVFKSKSKGIIEGGFNVLQRWLGHTGTDIGRVRGEFEEATKRLRQAQSTGVCPLTLGFLTQEASSLAHEEAAAIINSRPMQRGHLSEMISPDDLTARLGWHSTPLAESDAWYFRPYKCQRTVRAGTVNVTPGNGWAKQYFQLNGIRDGVHFENGHQVLLAYDPARPDLGAYVCNGDQSAKNREGWKLGQLLLPTAPSMGLAPQFNASGILSPHLVVRKKASAAAATTFRAIRAAAGLPQPSGSRETVVMNGSGGVASAGNLPREESAHSSPTSPHSHSSAAPAAQIGPVPDSIRPQRQTLAPVVSSRAMPADPAAEIARLTAQLLAAD